MTLSRVNIETKLNKEVAALLKQDALKPHYTQSKGKLSFSEFMSDKMLMMAAIRAGVPYSLFDLIQSYSPFTETDWANLLDISTKTLQRYKTMKNYSFKPIHSEKIIEVAEVMESGMEVFGSLDKFKKWLDTPNFALGNLTPMELLKDSYGKDMVLAELNRINHGILV